MGPVGLLIGSHLAGRYAVIGAALEAGDADVACFQEVFTWWHLRLLARRMGEQAEHAVPDHSDTHDDGQSRLPGQHLAVC